MKGVDAYRSRIQGDSDFMWKCFDRFDGMDFYPSLVEVETTACSSHHRWYRLAGKHFPNKCDYCVGLRYSSRVSLNRQVPKTFWVRKDSEGRVVMPDGTVMNGDEATVSTLTNK